MRRMESSVGKSVALWGGRALGAGILMLSGCAVGNGGSSEGVGNNPGAEASTGVGVGASPSAGPKLRIVEELADNRNGVPVFSDNAGSAFENGKPDRIAYGVGVLVDCYAPNRSGMGSINAFYHVAESGGQWDGGFIPANTMDNGAGLGPNAVTLDPRVQQCPPGTPRLVP